MKNHEENVEGYKGEDGDPDGKSKVADDKMVSLADQTDVFGVLHKQRAQEEAAHEDVERDYPEELREVALLLRAMPVTQVSVERLFSALRLLKSERRSRLKEDVLKAILVLKANK